MIEDRKFFAFVDKKKREWDYSDHADSLVYRRQVLTDTERDENIKKEREVLNIWKFLARAQQGAFMIEAFLLHTDILLIDPEGDAHYRCPHLYAEFSGPSGPYSGFNPRLSVRGEEIDLDDSWRRIGFFPKTLSGAEREFRVQQTQRINLDPETLKRFQE